MIRRSPTLSHGGMIATSHPQATEVGAAILRKGGHAIDALIAAAAVLSVVEPSASGLGGDAFFLVDSSKGHDRGPSENPSSPLAINGSGRSPATLTRDHFAGQNSIPLRSPLSCTTPGCIAAWEDAWKRWGRIPWAELFGPAISFAKDGYPVSWRMGAVLHKMAPVLVADSGLASVFLNSDGSPLRTGQRCRPSALGQSLTQIANEGAGALYTGSLGERLVEGVRKSGGCLSREDLAEHRSETLAPYKQSIGPYEVYEQPLPSQGLLLQIMLGVVSAAGNRAPGRSAADNYDPVVELHRQCESKKIAFALKEAFFTDPEFTPVPHTELADILLRESTIERLSLLLDQEVMPGELVSSIVVDAFCESSPEAASLVDAYRSAGTNPADPPPAGSGATDTTYLCAVDEEGNSAGLIQSIFHVFGAGYLEPSTGIILNNRACGFSLHPHHINALAPKKKSVHTLNSYLIRKDGKPWLVGGTPGGDNQVQTNLQVLRSVMSGRKLWPGPLPQRSEKWTQERVPEDPQLSPPVLLSEALEAPRWRMDPDGTVRIESRMAASIRKRLARKGHLTKRLGPWEGSGLVQAILRWEADEGDGVLVGATDPRGEGNVLGVGSRRASAEISTETSADTPTDSSQ